MARNWIAIGALLAAAPLAVAATLRWGPDPLRIAAARELCGRGDGYQGSATCRTCHPDQYASWRRTYHATMTQLPTRASVLGSFDGRAVELFGARATPFERDGRWFMELPAIGAAPARTAEVALCVGSNRYQQYFERAGAGPGDAYRRLPLLWHVGEQRWMHLNGVFLEPDSDDWGAHAAIWNENCIFCHNTAPAPRLASAGARTAPAVERFDSRVAELGIACESCHGPGAAHADANVSPLARYAEHLGLASPTDVVHPARLAQAEANAVCGQCHSQRLPDPPDRIWTLLDSGPTFRPGGTLAGHVAPVTRDTPTLDPGAPGLFRDRFWGDGTARLTAYEYLGVTQSPCFAGGELSCGSCHVMHGGDVHGQIEPELRGDRACTQCHAEIARDVAAHTHHAAGSSGSRCLECHMPRIVYGVLDVHRSHRIESPDVARDVEAGRPDACTSCHADRSALWAAERMRAWWGERYRAPASRPDGAPLDAPEALASLHAGDAVQRAVQAAALGRADGSPPEASAFAVAHLIVALGDAYPSVRWLARRSLLALDARLELGLGAELAAFDPTAAPDARAQALRALLVRFPERARARCAPPQPGLLLAPDFRIDLDGVRALLDRQQGRVIAIGE